MSIGTGGGLMPAHNRTDDKGLPEFSFFIPGTPAPQGSKTGFSPIGTAHVSMVESSKRVKPWRAAVTAAALAEADAEGTFDALAVAVRVLTHFVIDRPKTVKAAYPTSLRVGDGDKLTRATWDGLVQGGLLADDKFICDWGGSKRYAVLGEPSGCLVTVEVIA